MDLEDRYVTATPEGVSVEVVLAGTGSRLMAIMLDTLIQGALFFVILAIVLAISAAGAPALVTGGSAAILGMVDFFGYFLLLEAVTSGRTVGKMAVGTRTIRVDGRPLGFMSSLVRTVLRIVDYQVVGLVGLSLIFSTKRNQRLGDLAGGTIVVRERRAASSRRRTQMVAMPFGQSQGPLPVPSAFGVTLDARGWDVSAVDAETAVLAERFLRSRAGYNTDARARLADQLYRRIAPNVAGAPAGLPQEQFLEGVVAAKTGVGWAVPIVMARPATQGQAPSTPPW